MPSAKGFANEINRALKDSSKHLEDIPIEGALGKKSLRDHS